MELTREQSNQLVAEWIKDLESGKFNQVQCVLEAKAGNCCLGVLCRTFDRLYPGQLKIEPDPVHPRRTMFDGDSGFLPEKVRKAARISNRSAEFSAASHPHLSLTHLNDRGKSFAEIAAIVREEPDGLFEPVQIGGAK